MRRENDKVTSDLSDKGHKGPKGQKGRGRGGAAPLGGFALVGHWLAKGLPQASLRSLLSLASLFCALSKEALYA